MRAWYDAEPNTFSSLTVVFCLADTVCPLGTRCPRDVHGHTLRVGRA
jgi:hypothetical protein